MLHHAAEELCSKRATRDVAHLQIHSTGDVQWSSQCRQSASASAQVLASHSQVDAADKRATLYVFVCCLG